MKDSRLGLIIIGCTALLLAGDTTLSAPPPKGGQRQMEMRRPSSTQKQAGGQLTQRAKSPLSPDPQVGSPLTTSTNNGWRIDLINADPDTRVVFDAFLREALNNVIGVDRLPAQSDTEGSFFVRCVFPSFESFKSAVESSIKSVSENGLLTSTEVIAPAKLRFTNCTVEAAKTSTGTLEIRLPVKELLPPGPENAVNGVPQTGVVQRATNRVPQTILQAGVVAPRPASDSGHSAAAKVVPGRVVRALAILEALGAALCLGMLGVFWLSKFGLRHLRRRLAARTLSAAR